MTVWPLADPRAEQRRGVQQSPVLMGNFITDRTENDAYTDMRACRFDYPAGDPGPQGFDDCIEAGTAV